MPPARPSSSPRLILPTPDATFATCWPSAGRTRTRHGRIDMKSAILLVLLSLGVAQQARFDDVVRNLRNPDPKARMTALKMLGESKYVEAVLPIVPLVNDPVDAIQLEAIGTELSFFLVDDVRSRKRVDPQRHVRRKRIPRRSARDLAASRASRAGRGAAQGGGRREPEGARRGDLYAWRDRAAASLGRDRARIDQSARSL